MLQGGPIRRGRPRTAALRLKSVRVFFQKLLSDVDSARSAFGRPPPSIRSPTPAFTPALLSERVRPRPPPSHRTISARRGISSKPSNRTFSEIRAHVTPEPSLDWQPISNEVCNSSRRRQIQVRQNCDHINLAQGRSSTRHSSRARHHHGRSIACR